MNKLIFFSIIILLIGCSLKPKTVLICGDHVCVNKKEAKMYFEENLSLEVKIINTKEKNKIDLVKLNLDNSSNKKKIYIQKKDTTESKIKDLTLNEINTIKTEVKKKEKQKKLSNKVKKNRNLSKNNRIEKKNKENKKIKNVNKNKMLVEDVCTIIEKCSIDEISKYLIKEGKKKKFPDITIRQ